MGFFDSSDSSTNTEIFANTRNFSSVDSPFSVTGEFTGSNVALISESIDAGSLAALNRSADSIDRAGALSISSALSIAALNGQTTADAFDSVTRNNVLAFGLLDKANQSLTGALNSGLQFSRDTEAGFVSAVGAANRPESSRLITLAIVAAAAVFILKKGV